MSKGIAWVNPGFRGHAEWGNAIDMLTIDAKDFATGGENGGARTAVHDRFRQRGHCIDNVLAIIQNKEQVPGPDRTRDGGGGNLLAVQLETEDARERGGNQLRVGKRGQLDQQGSALKA